MSDPCPKRDSMSIEEATISKMWEIAAIVEMLEQERKGLCTKQDLHEARPLRHHRRISQKESPC